MGKSLDGVFSGTGETYQNGAAIESWAAAPLVSRRTGGAASEPHNVTGRRVCKKASVAETGGFRSGEARDSRRARRTLTRPGEAPGSTRHARPRGAGFASPVHGHVVSVRRLATLVAWLARAESWAGVPGFESTIQSQFRSQFQSK